MVVTNGLKELAEKLNVPFDDTSLHDSLYDCEILQQCFFNLIKKHKSVFNIETIMLIVINKMLKKVKQKITGLIIQLII
jgi:DNA polymerase III epsilon subunit-like protein